MPRGISFFHTDKDQFERLRLLVIRYKMVVGGLVCQKSIAGVIYFTLPTGSYSEDSPASTHTRTHTHTHTHNIIKWFTPDSSFSGICQCAAMCWGIFIWNFSSNFFYHLHIYSLTVILWVAMQVHSGLGPYLSKWDWQLAFSSQRDYREGEGRKVFFALLLSDTALTFTVGSNTAPTTKLSPHPNKLREKLKAEDKSCVKGIWKFCTVAPSLTKSSAYQPLLISDRDSANVKQLAHSKLYFWKSEIILYLDLESSLTYCDYELD